MLYKIGVILLLDWRRLYLRLNMLLSRRFGGEFCEFEKETKNGMECIRNTVGYCCVRLSWDLALIERN